MLKNLQFDINMRGYAFEFIAKVMLRRTKKNNFIFALSQFDSHKEIVKKYRLQTKSKKVKDILNYFDNHGIKGDVIEFVLDNVSDRNIKDIIIYEVKTKNSHIVRSYYEICRSSYDFYNEFTQYFGLDKIKLISIILYNNWRFSFQIKEYGSSRIRVYSRYKKK